MIGLVYFALLITFAPFKITLILNIELETNSKLPFLDILIDPALTTVSQHRRFLNIGQLPKSSVSQHRFTKNLHLPGYLPILIVVFLYL